MKTSTSKPAPESQNGEITLPKSTPGLADLISGWEDGGVYDVTITQVRSDDKSVTLKVEPEDEEAEDTGEESEMGMEGEPESPPEKMPKSNMSVKY